MNHRLILNYKARFDQVSTLVDRAAIAGSARRGWTESSGRRQCPAGERGQGMSRLRRFLSRLSLGMRGMIATVCVLGLGASPAPASGI